MKNIFLFLSLIIFSSYSYAKEAIVLVLQAPLLKEPSMTSNVLQYIRKGEKVYIPDPVANIFPLPEYIETYDRAGNIAYVPSKYIKIITGDMKEYLTPLAYDKYDPTDYRIEEPIPTTYPFSNYAFLKAAFVLSYGTNVKSPYAYTNSIKSQDYSSEKGGRFILTRRVLFDQYDRFYFGMILGASSRRNLISFTNQDTATESRSLLQLGPILSFDIYKNFDYRLTLGTGFTYNLHKARISYTDSIGNAEARLFSTYSLSPYLTAYLQFQDFLPKTDLLFGTDVFFYLNRNLSADDPAELNLWPSDAIREQAKPQANLYFGVQVKY